LLESRDTTSKPIGNNPKPELPLDDPSLFLSRELSWIRFNVRVLEETIDPWHPLLERIKFLAICGSNLDEFFMTRIPRLIKKLSKASDEKSVDGLSPFEQIEATRKEILPLLQSQACCWREELVPSLAKEGIYIKSYRDLTRKQKETLQEYFIKSILPTLKIPRTGINTTIIENLQTYLFIQKGDFLSSESNYVVPLPTEKFGRLIKIPQMGFSDESSSQTDSLEITFVFLEDLISNNLDLLFPNEKTMVAYPFRLTRNGEIDIFMDESSDFLASVTKSLQNRKTGFPSRLEFDKKIPLTSREAIARAFGLPNYLIYESDGPLGLVDLWQLLKLNRPDLKDKSFLPCISPLLTPGKNLFTTIANRDFVLYHPYDSFEIIIDLLREASRDRQVQEIFITMYRMDHRSPIVDSLIEAAKNGVKVTAIIELKAKFDEANNILLASKLREAGVNTVYNFPNFKVHAKLCLIVRKEKSGIVRYSHIGSGNYNAVTAKIYGDIGYLTSRVEIGQELAELFNILINGLQETEFKHLLVAPKSLKKKILKRIDREIAFHRKTGKGHLAFKLNNLEEKAVIQALYRASMAGIKIDLNVRGLCCLKPGIKGVSENISVISIVGRFLEHARIYYFHDNGDEEVLIGSSDLMFRNLNERVEVLLSVPDRQIRHAILENMLKIHLHDNVKARILLPDGTYRKVTPKEGNEIINSQMWLLQNRGIWHEPNP
jgi:polyphosphate kinase